MTVCAHRRYPNLGYLPKKGKECRVSPYDSSSSGNLCNLCNLIMSRGSSICISCGRNVCKVCIFWCTRHKEKRYCNECNDDYIVAFENRWACKVCRGQ